MQPLTESEVRTYFKCSQLHWYGDRILLDPIVDLIRLVLERILTMRLSGTTRDNEEILSEAISSVLVKARKDLTDYDIIELQSRLIILTVEFFKLFSFKIYEPIYGPSTVRVRVSRTPIDAQFSCILKRTNSQELHMVVWTPYTTHQDQLNDPLNFLRIQAFKQFVKFSTSRAACTLHLLNVQGDGLLYSNLNDKDIDPSYERQLIAKIQAMERKEHFPCVPCSYTCPHKQFCSPLGLKDKREPNPASSASSRDHRFKRLC